MCWQLHGLSFNMHDKPNNVARPVWEIVQKQGHGFGREIVVRAVTIDRLIMARRVEDKCSNFVDFQAPKRNFLLVCLRHDQEVFREKYKEENCIIVYMTKVFYKRFELIGII